MVDSGYTDFCSLQAGTVSLHLTLEPLDCDTVEYESMQFLWR